MIRLLESVGVGRSYLIILLLSILLFGFYQWTIVIAGFYLCFMYRDKRALPNLTFILLAAALFTFLLFGYLNGNITIQMVIFFSFSSICFFYIGSYLVDHSRSEAEIIYVFALVIIAMALPHIIVTIQDIFTVGLVNPDRILTSIADGGDGQRSVTQRTVEISLCIGSIAFFFAKPKSNLGVRTKKILVIVACICEICALHYVSRTGIAILCIGLLIGFLFSWGISIRSCALLLVLFIGYHYVQNSELYDVFAARDTDYSNVSNVGLRTVRWEWGLKEIKENPFGSTTYMYALHSLAHNFWIDYGKISGYIPFVLLILLSIRNLFQSIIIGLRRIGILSYFAVVYTPIFIATLMTEPVHEGAPLYMFVYFMYIGMINRIYFKYKKHSKSIKYEVSLSNTPLSKDQN